jgi:glycosyltransferase involved in cell wall biosynthesis
MTPRSRKPYHVLLFSSFSNLGNGGQESLFQLVSRLQRDEFSPRVVTPARGTLSERLKEQSIDVDILNLPKVAAANIKPIVEAYRRLCSTIKKEKIDILHTDGPRNTFWAALAGRLKGKAIVWHVRASTPDPYDRLLYLLVSKIILVADGLRVRFPFKNQSKKCVTIYNGVDLEHFSPQIESRGNQSAFGSQDDKVVITVTGRVERRKGQQYLVQACSYFKHLWPRLRILFAGEITDKSYYRNCMQCANELGLSSAVHFLGHVQNVREILRLTDIFVLPSIEGEGFPRSVLEAMACGKPVVLTDVGGSKEAIEDGMSGFAISPKNSAELGQKLSILLTNSDLQIRMGQAARMRAERLFGIQNNVKHTMALYEEVLRDS